jgi:hypothetical protein
MPEAIGLRGSAQVIGGCFILVAVNRLATDQRPHVSRVSRLAMMLTQPKLVDEIYNELPESKRDHIAKRDGKTGLQAN